ncbi:MAG TPA: enoyl-CoA hydratase-related protein [Amycolatopsis sp.]|nr:enoyl-CoA hydratase-related protein [Amycolatopsis sp.]
MAEPLVLTERVGACLRVTLNDPVRRNALSPDLLDALLSALDEGTTDDVRVVVLTGAGPAFSVGGDLALRATGRGLLTPDRHESRARVRRAERSIELLAEMAPVTVAAINGACAGAGLSLASICDLRIAAANARFNTAFLTAGVSGDFAGIWSVTRLLGPGRARELFLLPGRFDAARAAEVGLVSEVVAAEAFESHIREVVQRLVDCAPLALKAMKQNLVDAERLALSDYLDAECERYLDTGTSADSIEAARAYLDKRPPTFTGA